MKKSFKNCTRKLKEFLFTITQNRNTKKVRPVLISLIDSKEGGSTLTEQILHKVPVQTRVAASALLLILSIEKAVVFKIDDTIEKVLGYLVMVLEDLPQEDPILHLVGRIPGAGMAHLVHLIIQGPQVQDTLTGKEVGTMVDLGQATKECLQEDQMTTLDQTAFRIEECLNIQKIGTF